jgi:hypothetical protein
METLRALLVQRAARLQERPALTTREWGTLSWGAWRNRVEGVGFALLARTPIPSGVHSGTGTPWDWACEVAAACCGLTWDPAAGAVDLSILGGDGFHPEEGRGPYHDRERSLGPDTPFTAGLNHGAMLARLQRLNRTLEWDHRTELRLPRADLASPATRAALWSLLFAGGHAILESPAPAEWNPSLFAHFWAPHV